MNILLGYRFDNLLRILLKIYSLALELAVKGETQSLTNPDI